MFIGFLVGADVKRQQNEKGVHSSIPLLLQGKPRTCCCCEKEQEQEQRGEAPGVESRFGSLSIQ